MKVENEIKLAGGRDPGGAGWVATWRLWLLWCHDVAVVVLSLSLFSCSFSLVLVLVHARNRAVALYMPTLNLAMHPRGGQCNIQMNIPKPNRNFFA